MKNKRTLLWLAFLMLTLMNVLIFFKRRHFEYKSYSSVRSLYAVCDENCVDNWQRYVDDYPKEDQKQVDKLLNASMPASDSTIENIRKLSAFLLSHFNDQRGVPSEFLLSKSPLAQFNLLRLHHGEKLWCGNWSNIFAYFAWNRGITTRIVEIFKPGDHHVFNECFVPELNGWVMVDLTNQIILPTDSAGNFLHGVGFANTGRNALVRSTYYRTEYPWYYYYRYNLTAVYAPESRMKRYLIPDPWYEILDVKKDMPGNFLFYVKLIAFFLWLIFLFMILMSLMSRS